MPCVCVCHHRKICVYVYVCIYVACAVALIARIMSRKRFRPLDAAELQDVDVLQCMSVSTIEDERCYCFSWPESPLTDVMIKTGYAHSCLFTAQTGNSAAALGISKTSSNTNAAPPVVLPPVYTVNDAVSHDLHDLEHILDSLDHRTKNETDQCATPLTELESASGAEGKCNLSEDDVFSFSDRQWEELCSSGVVALTQQCLFRSTGAVAPSSECDVQHALYDERRSDVDYVQQMCTIRYVLELEMVELERRTRHELQKTAASLECLLSLPSAVPFLLSYSSSITSASQNSRRHVSPYTPSKGGCVVDVDSSNAWRYALYVMFIAWRLRSAGVCMLVNAHRKTHAHSTSATTSTVPEVLHCLDNRSHEDTKPAISLSAPHERDEGAGLDVYYLRVHENKYKCYRHSWGSPLLVGAYIHALQNEYFINAHKIFTSHGDRPYTTYDKDDDDLLMSSLPWPSPGVDKTEGEKTFHTEVPALHVSTDSIAGHGARCNANVTSVHDRVDTSTSRARGLYGFLRWKVETYATPPLLSEKVHQNGRNVTVTERQSKTRAPGTKRTMSTPVKAVAVHARHDNKGDDDDEETIALQSVLHSSAIEALIRERVLSAPLVDVAMTRPDSTGVVSATTTADICSDHRMCGQDAILDALSCPDLCSDIETWRAWLSYM